MQKSITAEINQVQENKSKAELEAEAKEKQDKIDERKLLEENTRF